VWLRSSCEVSSWVMETNEARRRGGGAGLEKAGGGHSRPITPSTSRGVLGRPEDCARTAKANGSRARLRVTLAQACRRGWPAAQSFLAGCSLCIGSPGRWQRDLRDGRRGGGSHRPGSGSRYRMRPSGWPSSRASSFDAAHLRISCESSLQRHGAVLINPPCAHGCICAAAAITTTLCDRPSIFCARPRPVAVESAHLPGLATSPNLGARLPSTPATKSLAARQTASFRLI
jgi:hypothetical protein